MSKERIKITILNHEEKIRTERLLYSLPTSPDILARHFRKY